MKWHPDKNAVNTKDAAEAYDVLSHPEKRQIYDLEKAAVVETNLPCSSEELYKGSRRKMKISRVVLDASGKPITLQEVLAIHVKPGWKKSTKITFPDKGSRRPDLFRGRNGPSHFQKGRQ